MFAKRNFAIHNSYKDYLDWKGYVDFDIALLELEKPINLQQYPNIRPACLPSSSDVSKSFQSETYGTVIGRDENGINRDFVNTGKTISTKTAKYLHCDS